MTFLERIKLVDELMDDFALKVGMLTQHGVFTFEEGVEFIRITTEKQSDWIKTNFTQEEYGQYLTSRMNGEFKKDEEE